MPLTRISLTIPLNLLKELDKHAKSTERARSRVVVEAIRGYLTGKKEGTGGTEGPVTARVAEETRALYTVRPGLGAYRQQQLEADLQLTPTERVLAAEHSAQAAPRRRPPVPQRVIQFDRLEDFFAWQRADDISA